MKDDQEKQNDLTLNQDLWRSRHHLIRFSHCFYLKWREIAQWEYSQLMADRFIGQLCPLWKKKKKKPSSSAQHSFTVYKEQTSEETAGLAIDDVTCTDVGVFLPTRHLDKMLAVNISETDRYVSNWYTSDVRHRILTFVSLTSLDIFNEVSSSNFSPKPNQSMSTVSTVPRKKYSGN